MEASLSAAQRREGSRIRSSSRYGGGAAAAAGGRSVAGARPAWYRRALGGLHLWRQRAAVEAQAAAAGARERAPLWRASLKAVGTALARVACVCKPACSGVNVGALAPTSRRRRKEGRSGGRSPPVAQPAVSMPAGEWDNWRCVLLGMSLTMDDDVLIRRLVLEEEYATRRRVQMQAASKRSRRYWLPPGPSRLSQMSLADDDDDDLCGDDGAGESSSSTSPQCSEDQ